jgi:hypothetical protein
MSQIKVKGKYETSTVEIVKKDDNLPSACMISVTLTSDNPVPRVTHVVNNNGTVTSSLILSYHNLILLTSLAVDFIEKQIEKDLFNTTLLNISKEDVF